MSAMKRAPHVCTTCKAKKKACDKYLPRCGYCTTRSLDCSYDLDDCFSPDADVDAGVPFLLFCTPAQIWKQHSTWRATHTFPERLSLPSDLSSPNEPVTLDSILNLQVTRILQATGLSFHEISEQYFQDFHVWLPVICPSLFQETLAQYIVPPADFSLLKLAICLVTVHPTSPASEHSPNGGPESLYVFVKMLLSQVQAELCASVPLVQASLLISTYEYACGRPEKAYISMGMGVGMAYTLRINSYRDLQAMSLHGAGARLKVREAWNVWWGLIILQRYPVQV